MIDNKSAATAETTPIETVEEFLAHAQALEMERVERYEEMADCMDTHNNSETADFFRNFIETNEKRAREISSKAEGRELPHLSPWEYKWQEYDGPDAPRVQAIHYLMTPFHALSMACVLEERSLSFYRTVADGALHAEIKIIAAELVESKSRHIERLKDLISKHPEPKEGWDEDPDPPNMPE
jgi:rubrerythrin